MVKLLDNRESRDIARLYSVLGRRCLDGDVESLKVLYAASSLEHPAMVKTLALLMLVLTAVEIDEDDGTLYSDEFLYYYGMLCLGEGYRLIERNLVTARVCFEKIRSAVPAAEARLAYIELLLTTEPHASENNSHRLDTLRRWAGRQDLFSLIVLSKIVFEHYLRELPEDEAAVISIPHKAARLIETPCQQGHPLALQTLSSMLQFSVGEDAAKDRLKDSKVDLGILHDYEFACKYAIMP